MENSKKFFIRHPGGENEGGTLTENNEDEKTTDSEQASKVNTGKKTLMDKFRDALQDWSNADKQDQEFDDTRP